MAANRGVEKSVGARSTKPPKPDQGVGGIGIDVPDPLNGKDEPTVSTHSPEVKTSPYLSQENQERIAGFQQAIKKSEGHQGEIRHPEAYQKKVLQAYQDALQGLHHGNRNDSLLPIVKTGRKAYVSEAQIFSDIKAHGGEPLLTDKEILRAISKANGSGTSAAPASQPTKASKPQVEKSADDWKGIERTHDYTDAAGNLIFQVVKFKTAPGEQKKFAQRHKKDGRWISGMHGVERTLYRLPYVIENDHIVLVEGEKDVETLAGRDIAATTNPMGAGKWDESYTKALEGKHVLIIPDNDDAGEGHLKKVAALLHGRAASVMVADLKPYNVKDVSELLSKSATPDAFQDQLDIILTSAEPYTPGPREDAAPEPVKPSDVCANAGPADGVLICCVDATMFSAKSFPPKLAYLDPVVKQGQVILIVGPRGCGKTWLAMALVKTITKDESIGKWRTLNPAPCLYLDSEMASIDLQERLKAFDLDKPGSAPFYVYSDADACDSGAPRTRLLDQVWRESMQTTLLNLGVKVWVADNLSSLCPGIDENSKKEWDVVNQWVLDLKKLGITTILIHHTGKSGTQRGTSGREDNLDTVMHISLPANHKAEDGAVFEVAFTKNRMRKEEVKLIPSQTFSLSFDEQGKVKWDVETIKKKKREDIEALIGQGYSDEEIAAELATAKKYVARVRKEREEYLAAILAKGGKP